MILSQYMLKQWECHTRMWNHLCRIFPNGRPAAKMAAERRTGEGVKLGPLQHVLTQWRKEDKFKSTSKQLIRLNCICCILSTGENLCLCMQFGLSHGQWSKSSVFNVAPTSSSQINKVKQTIKMVINSSRRLALCQFKWRTPQPLARCRGDR